jgi:hypothetical protein
MLFSYNRELILVKSCSKKSRRVVSLGQILNNGLKNVSVNGSCSRCKIVIFGPIQFIMFSKHSSDSKELLEISRFSSEEQVANLQKDSSVMRCALEMASFFNLDPIASIIIEKPTFDMDKMLCSSKWVIWWQVSTSF